LYNFSYASVLSAIYLENYVILNCIFTTLRNRDAVIFVYHRLEIRITFRIAPGLGRLFFLANCGPCFGCPQTGLNKWGGFRLGFIRAQNWNLLRRFESHTGPEFSATCTHVRRAKTERSQENPLLAADKSNNNGVMG